MKKGVEKILIIPSWYPTKESPNDGIFFKEQAEAIVKANVNVDVFYMQMASRRAIKKNLSVLFPHFSVHTVNKVRTVRFSWVWFFSRNTYKDFFEKIILWFFYKINIVNGYDIIHAHSVIRAGGMGLYLASIMKKPFILTEHSTYFARNRYSINQLSYIRNLINSSYKTIAVSEPFLNTIHEKTKCELGRLIYIPNLVNTDFFDPGQKLLEKANRFVFATVSFLVQKKGLDVLLKAFSRVCLAHPDCCLVVGGDGPLFGELTRLSFSLGVGPKVLFLGSLNRYGVRKLLKRADVYISASIFETFGVSLIEALSMGLPIVATRSGGPESIVRPINGFLVDVEDEVGLANAMCRMIENHSSFSHEAIRNDCISRFGEKSVIEAIMNLYTEAVVNYVK